MTLDFIWVACWTMEGGSLRKNETIPVGPLGVLWVEPHELVEQDVRDGCHAHRGTGVTRVGLARRIDL